MSKQVQQVVQERYGSIAESGLSGKNTGVRIIAEAFGYSGDDLASIPVESNMGLSCGNPTAHASLRPGETVVDLGCGGGLDVFLASAKVGPTGRAIGIDMTPEMIDRARRNAEKGKDGIPYTNVEFHLATIDKLPLADKSVDCVISNCVINLAPDKQAVFREVERVLRPGGRLAISDIALKRSLPSEISNDLLAYVGCIAGALPIEDYRRGLIDAGFEPVEIIDTRNDLSIYAKASAQDSPSTPLPVVESSCCSTLDTTGSQLAELLSRYDINDYAASVRVYAVKPMA
jgi:arsenite methyltransferase